jgi:large subunit ribosomal protein L10
MFLSEKSLKGGINLAITKERKAEILEQYSEWLSNSRAVIFTEYTGLGMKEIDTLRAKVREAGGEFHVIKNTLGKIAFEKAGFGENDFLVGSTAVGFAFEDAPSVAKALSEFADKSDFVNIKGGFLGSDLVGASQIKALADLPPLPIVRSQLLGVLQAPAAKLVRTLAEPGRSLAAVIKANVDQQSAAA